MRHLPGVRVNEFPLNLEELFVELFQPEPGSDADEAKDSKQVGNPDRPGGRVILEPNYRVGRGPTVTVAPASRDRDA